MKFCGIIISIFRGLPSCCELESGIYTKQHSSGLRLLPTWIYAFVYVQNHPSQNLKLWWTYRNQEILKLIHQLYFLQTPWPYLVCPSWSCQTGFLMLFRAAISNIPSAAAKACGPLHVSTIFPQAFLYFSQRLCRKHCGSWCSKWRSVLRIVWAWTSFKEVEKL